MEPKELSNERSKAVRRLITGSCVALLFCVLANGPVLSQVKKCDAGIAVDESDLWSYGWRGNRCEGRYVEPLGGGTIRLVGYYAGTSWQGTARLPALRVEWPSRSTGDVELRAISLRWRTFYRMDAVVSAKAQRFLWSTEVLRALRLRAEEVGLTAIAGVTLPWGTERLLVPVKIADEAHAAPGRLKIVLMSDDDLDEIQLGIRSVTDTIWIRPISKIREGTFMARRPITVELPSLPPGVYQLLCMGIGAPYRVLSVSVDLLVPAELK